MLVVMSDVLLAHKHSSKHREEVLASRVCGCFHCLKTFAPARIKEWVDWPAGTPADQRFDRGTTALCPYCSIDAVVGDKSGLPVGKELLVRMKWHWFHEAP